MSELLFTYGTLKKNCTNHHYLKTSKFIGEAYTLKKFLLYHKGYPYIVPDKNGFSIKGELYEIDLNTFKQIDELEDYPEEYQKAKVEVIYKKEKKWEKTFSWLYFYPEKEDGIKINKVKYNYFLKIFYFEWEENEIKRF